MNKKRILVVDDEEDLCEILKFNLEQAGFEVETALSAEEALMLNIASFDLILLDIMMGEISGFKMAGMIRKSGINIPIIFCTAKDEEEDMLTGLEIGGDDYISKPFSVKEVVARVKTVLRRTSDQGKKEVSSGIFQSGTLILNADTKKVTLSGEEIDLTKTEFEILRNFMQNPGKIYSREELLYLVWDKNVFVNERTVDVHIARLRKKIGVDGKKITPRSGYGYYFENS